LQLLHEADTFLATQPARYARREHREGAPSNLQVLNWSHGQTVPIRTYVRKSESSAGSDLGAPQIGRATPDDDWRAGVNVDGVFPLASLLTVNDQGSRRGDLVRA
jgi:hypothetical protein